MLSRIKFEIEPLVAEILDQLPDSVWSSDTTTFFDPAMGGGQFVREIETRLRDAGHSDDNIRSRVYGIEESDLHLRFAVNKFKLVGQYSRMPYNGFFGLETDMKFDVVVGNPPYQNPGKSKGQKLWYKFIFKNYELLKDGGYLAMVTPNSWIRGGVNHGRLGVLKDIFSKKQLVIASFKDITKTHFGKIGVDISWWIFKNSPITEKTKFILTDCESHLDLTDIDVMSPVADSDAISILTKFIDSKFAKENIIYFNYKNSRRDQESTLATDTHKIKHWVHGCSQKGNASFTYLPSRFNDKLDFNKVLFLIGSRYWQPHVDTESVGVIAQGFAIPTQPNWTKEGILSVYESKLWKLIFFTFQLKQNGFMKNAIVKKTPAMDMSRVWTDKEIYQYFDLTSAEIDYVEANVK